MTVKEYNEKAFQALRDLDFLTAQTLFRNNRKENPGFVSSQNLGAFYLHNGMDLSNGKTRSAIKDGIRLFQEALQYKSDAAISYAALGAAYADLAFFRHGEYADAEKAYRKAISLEENWQRWYSLGAIRNEFGDYEEAASCFQKALSLCDGDQEDKTNTELIYIYCVSLYDKSRSIKLLQTFLSMGNPCFSITNMAYIFLLAYQCRDYMNAILWLEKALPILHLDISQLAMAFDCYEKMEKSDKILWLFDLQMKKFDGFNQTYCIKNEVRKVKKIFLDSTYRNKIISVYKLGFSIIKEDYYVD